MPGLACYPWPSSVTKTHLANPPSWHARRTGLPQGSLDFRLQQPICLQVANNLRWINQTGHVIPM